MALRDVAKENAAKAQVRATLRELGEELHRVRTVVLQCKGNEMAQWLGIATHGPDGTPTSTGKSQISQYEKGRRLPDEKQIEQYCRAPGANVDKIRDLYSAAVAADLESRLPSTTTPPLEAEPGTAEPPAPGNRARRVLISAAAVLIIASAAVVATLIAHGSTEPTPQSSSSVPLEGVRLVFDALGPKTDQTINVYPGYTNSAADHESDLTYHDGEKAAVICKVQGRPVTSDPSAGERRRSTDIWVRIRSSTGLIRYATLTYARVVPATAKVPVCPP